MKTALWISLLLLLLLPALAYGQQQDSLGFKAQKEVVYPVRSATRLEAAIDWYTGFFGQKPQLIDKVAEHPYAVFNVDGIVVRLTTDPKYLGLDDPLFYWMLPTPGAVTAKFEALRGSNRFKRHFFSAMRHYGGIRLSRQRTDADGIKVQQVKQVLGFIIFDPEGNQVAVINNPIYPPRK